MDIAAIYQLLLENFGADVVSWQAEGLAPQTVVKVDRIADVARFLREDPRLEFDLLMCLSGIDWDGFDESGKGKSVGILGYNQDGTPEISDRVATGELGVAYHLYSYRHAHKFAMQVRLPRDAAEVPSVAGPWPTAAWHEREAFDLVGIRFAGHPNLQRILCDDAWEGHPLRKDYQMPSQWQDIPLVGQPYSVNPHQKPEPPPPAGEGRSDE
jgi:NADH-quinone oxidoreductase subunit C